MFQWHSSLIVLPTYGLKNAVLVFHISNFSDRYPGFSKPIKFGLYSTISAQKNKDTILFVIIAGYLLVVGAFFISLYLFYKKENAVALLQRRFLFKTVGMPTMLLPSLVRRRINPMPTTRILYGVSNIMNARFV